jgi:Holliday junction resolvase
MNHIEHIVKNTVIDIYQNKISSLSFDDNSGYVNFYWGTYAQQIGKELLDNNIPFSSLYDAGYGHDFDKSDPTWSKQYTAICKKTPNYEFMKAILPADFQKEILLKTLEHFDFNKCLSDYTKANSIIHIVRDYREVGINRLYINDEITEKVTKYSKKNSVHPNVFISFIHEGFFFHEDFLMKTIKQSYKITFSNSSDNDFNELYSLNEKNKIQYNYLIMNEELDGEEKPKNKKMKI